MSCAAICINPVTDNLEFPDCSAFLQWKEREETETFICSAKPNGNKGGKNEGKMLHKYSVHVLACRTTTEVETTVLYTCCRDGRAKIIQRSALRAERIMDHVNWRNTACLELRSERREVERFMPSTFVLTQIKPLG